MRLNKEYDSKIYDEEKEINKHEVTQPSSNASLPEREGVSIVRLGTDAINEVKSIMFYTLLKDPFIRKLFDCNHVGFKKRVKAAGVELVEWHYINNQDIIGVANNEGLAAIALLASPFSVKKMLEYFRWSLRLFVCSGVNCTRKYVAFLNNVEKILPHQHHFLTMGVAPDYFNLNYEFWLLLAVKKMCGLDPWSTGIVSALGNENSRVSFDRAGFNIAGWIEIDDTCEPLLYTSLVKVPNC